MRFEDNKDEEKGWKIIGFILSYFVFTTVLFFLLRFLKKIPSSWSYLNIMIITLIITATGMILSKYLK
jgi:hypothetical protein